MKFGDINTREAWCEEFATAYRFETKLDRSVCVSVARKAFERHGSVAPAVAVTRLLAGKVTRACTAGKTSEGSFHLRRQE